MKVRELIEVLSDHDPETEVCMISENFELNGAIVPVGGVHEQRVKKIEEEFVDAFDRHEYVKKVYRVSLHDGEKVLRIFSA